LTVFGYNLYTKLNSLVYKGFSAMVSAKRKLVILLFIGVVIGVVGLAMYMSAGKEDTDDAVLSADVATISPRVSGYVTSLKVVDNQLVKAGDVLLEIDPTDYQIALDKALASLDAAKAKVSGSVQNFESTKVSAPSGLIGAEAQVKQAQATWENSVKTLKRIQTLSEIASSKQQLDDAIADEKRALEALNDAKSKLVTAQTAPQTIAAAQSEADENSALVMEAEAEVAQAKKNLADTKVLAPFDGRVTSRGVVVGNYIQAGQNLLSVVGKTFWVTANFKETQLTDMRAGQKVDVRVDAYPDLHLSGKVDSIQSGTGSAFSAFPPQNATGNFVKIVQRVPVKITLDNPGDDTVIFGVGMSVVPVVYTGK
jgi:membrane fusion protein (multidrug efflux system)